MEVNPLIAGVGVYKALIVRFGSRMNKVKSAEVDGFTVIESVLVHG